MKVEICMGARCTFYGASAILDSLHNLKETLPDFSEIPENADFELVLVPCQNLCRDDRNSAAPIVWVDGEKIERAKSQEVMEVVMQKLRGISSDK